jgi:hypothetical protein
MTSKGPFNENSDDTLKEISAARIGELITMFVGEDELQKRFEETPEFQKEDFEGKPSGIIALDLGIINKDTKNALLVAQAAARAVCVAMGYEDQKPANDEVFKFVGSDRDPELLKESQGNWQIANIIDNDAQTIAAFKHHASLQMSQAAETLKAEGFEDSAVKVAAVAQSIFVSADSFEKSPSELAHDTLLQYINDNPGEYKGSEYVVSDEITAMKDTLKKLRDISSRGAGVPKGYVPLRQGPTKP